MGKQPRTPRGQQRLFEKKLFYGDNLDILRAPEHFKPESVDLIYLDPPFKPNERYNVLFRDEGDKDRVPSASQVRAFDDTWKWGSAARDAFNDVKENAPHHVRETVESLHTILGFSNMFAYLAMMAPRLVELHQVLKPTGSIYLHCDPAASHYLKVVMDSVFGPEQFRNEIIWKRANAHNDPKRFGRISDTILYYSKSQRYVWNKQHTNYREDYYKSHYTLDDDGRYYRTVPLDAPRHGEGSPALLYEWRGKMPAATRTWAVIREKMEEYERQGLIRYTRTRTPTLLQYADEMPGVLLQNIWTDIPPVNPQARERLGYPTQKPVALLERVITASSNEGQVVLDPFCGCGTTIEAAEALGRNWLGIDITYDAIPIIRERLAKRGLEDGTDYEVEGAPTSNADAEKLARDDKYRFQWWAVRRLGGKETENIRKRGSDKGVDGRLTLITDAKGQFPEAIISVKGGHTGPAHVRELVGTIKAQKAAVGVLVVLRPPTKGMREAADAEGGYPGRGGEFCPRIQILTAEDIIKGVGVKAPVTFAVEQPARAKQRSAGAVRSRKGASAGRRTRRRKVI